MGMAVDPDSFRAAMARFPGAVTIVSARAATGRLGLTATAVCSVSAEPPSLLACVNRRTGTCAAVADSGLFNVSLLPDPSDALAMRFAGADGATGEPPTRRTKDTETNGRRRLEVALRVQFRDATCLRVDQANHSIY